MNRIQAEARRSQTRLLRDDVHFVCRCDNVQEGEQEEERERPAAFAESNTREAFSGLRPREE